MSDTTYDLIVIGGGPGGYEAALHAAKLGLKTALVEERQLGGTCLNRGCIPTKTLLHAAELYDQTKKMGMFGLSADHIYFDVKKMHGRKDEVLDKLRDGIAMLLKKAKVDVFQGRGRVEGPGRVSVAAAGDVTAAAAGNAAAAGETPCELSTKNILIATGAAPRKPPIPGAGGASVYTSDELLAERETLFDRLIIIGGGVIGCEFATVYNALGSQVVILEAESRILPLMDREISQSLAMSLKKKGVEIHTGAKVTGIVEGISENDMHCRYVEKDVEQKASGDCVLISIGRAPNTTGLFAEGLAEDVSAASALSASASSAYGKPSASGADISAESAEEAADRDGVSSAGIRLDRGFVVVDDHYETGIPGIYAIGDVIGGIQLAHVAAAEGTTAVEYMAGVKPSKDLKVVPSCIYTKPEIASVGLTADEAKARGVAVKTGKYSMLANGKSIIEEQERGFVKVVFREEDDVIVGAQLMCARATDLVTELSLAISAGLTREQVNAVIHPHPTFSEGIGEAVRG